MGGECPGQDTECSWRTCQDGRCGLSQAAPGTPLSLQTPGDCRTRRCNAGGQEEDVVDAEDIPEDHNGCTEDSCVEGVPTHQDRLSGASCGAGMVCDGQGSCVGCVQDQDCPGQDSECAVRVCEDGRCNVIKTPAGQALPTQTAGDCQQRQCDSMGNVIPTADDTDLPVDGVECTLDLCTAGAASNPPRAPRAACASDGGSMCNGSGACVGCLLREDCAGTDTECRVRSCVLGACGFANVAADTATPSQVAGDCHTRFCDGDGGVRGQVEDTDTPAAESACTEGTCTGGVPSQLPRAAGSACSQGGTVCDGYGACVGCLQRTECPGTDTECQTRTCTNGSCGFSFTPANQALSQQDLGDCRVRQCDGNGNLVSVPQDADLPVDGVECTLDLCTAGVPANPAAAGGTPCSGGQSVCNGEGACVQCVFASTCPGVDSACVTRTCTSYTCGTSTLPAGTNLPDQTAGDCLVNQCDAQGKPVAVPDDTDIPQDGNACTQDLCTTGVATHVPEAAGTACNQNGGSVCDGNGHCIPPVLTVAVLRVGTGTGALGSTATAAFVEKWTVTGTQVSVLPLPTAANGNQFPLTVSGTSTSEGFLARSADGHALVIPGYAATPGSATSSARVVGRLDAAGTLDTSTTFPGTVFSSNFRSAASVDGTAFWLAGSSSSVQWMPLGPQTPAPVMTPTNSNTRCVGVAEGSLYVTSSSTPIAKVGTGLPTTSGQAAVALNGVTGSSAYAFALLDRNAAVPGVDTLYLADDRAPGSGGGVQKWTFDGTTWTLAATFKNGLLSFGVRGLAAAPVGSGVTVVATTAETPARLISYVDDGSTTNPTLNVIATAATNTAYRGVALAPY